MTKFAPLLWSTSFAPYFPLIAALPLGSKREVQPTRVTSLAQFLPHQPINYFNTNSFSILTILGENNVWANIREEPSRFLGQEWEHFRPTDSDSFNTVNSIILSLGIPKRSEIFSAEFFHKEFTILSTDPIGNLIEEITNPEQIAHLWLKRILSQIHAGYTNSKVSHEHLTSQLAKLGYKGR